MLNNILDVIKIAEEQLQDIKLQEQKETKDKNIESLKISKFITEKAYDIIEPLIEGKKKILLIAPMKAGKSTFSFKELYPVLRACECQFIFISPKVTLLEQVQERYRVTSCYGGADVTLTGLPIITTPDSLYKVVKRCEEEQKQFTIIYDEVHEMELNYNHRHKLIYPLKYYEHELCIGFIGLTATPDNIIRTIKWDKVFKVEIENKFIQTPVTNIITGLDNTLNNILIHVSKTYIENKCPVVVRINDKKKIEDVEKGLTTLGITGINKWYRGNKNEEDDLMLTEMLNGTKCDFNILLTTSLVDVGVELNPLRKPIVIDFYDSNSRVIENIQFLGRFRDGVAGYDIVLPCFKEKYDFIEFEEVLKQQHKAAKQIQEVFNNYYSEIKTDIDVLKVNYDIETETYSYDIDEHAVNAKAFAFWIKQVIRDKNRLESFLINHDTFNSLEVRQLFLREDYKKDDIINALTKQLADEKKIIKQEFKQELESQVKQIKELKDEQIEVLLTKPDDIILNQKWIMRAIQETYDFYWSEEMKEYRKQFYSIEGYTKQGYTKKEILLKALDNKWYREFKKKRRYVEVNYMYDHQNEILQIDAQQAKIKKIVYTIRDTVKKLYSKEVMTKLSSKRIDLLYEECLKYKCLEGTSEKSFIKHLNLIYNLSTDRNKQINSIKKDIKFE